MSAEEYARYPAFIMMREVAVNGRILVTTLLDPKFASARDLGALYKMRWNIEVDFRTIKATLEMDVLRCKSRSMVEEIAVYFLAYNLVRWAMAKAALLAGILPRALSFTGAKRLLNVFADQLRRTSSNEIHVLITTVQRCMVTLRLPQRPDRIEPRAKKRRPKNLPLLTMPRQVARDLIHAQRMLNRVPCGTDPILFSLGVLLRAVRPELVEGQHFDKLRANGSGAKNSIGDHGFLHSFLNDGDQCVAHFIQSALLDQACRRCKQRDIGREQFSGTGIACPLQAPDVKSSGMSRMACGSA